MKLTIVLMITAFLQVSAAGYAQRITLSQKNASLEQVFWEISTQSGYEFLYDAEMLKEANPVNIKLNNASIDQVLRQCFAGQPLVYTIRNNTIIVKRKPFEALPPVTGKVTDEKGLPLPGASVKVKSTTIATITNANGEFSFANIDNEAVLEVSYLGFITQTVSVNGRSAITIILKEDTRGLSEVVVVGYGTQKRTTLTGAVSTVDAKMIENRPVTNTIGALQGAASGLTITRTSGKPGSENWGVQVRGISSTNGSERGGALVMIDGSPGELSSINPEDIESVSVLKDASAAAIYGARAAGGVVLITTKKGKPGKPVFNYTGFYGRQRIANVQEKVPAWMESQMTRIAQASTNPTINPYAYQREWEWQKDPDLSYVLDLDANQTDYTYYSDQHLTDIMLDESSPEQTHNLSVRGGTDKDTYAISFGYYNQDGMLRQIVQDKGQRINARLNYDRKLTDRLTFGANMSYSNNLYAGTPGSNFSGNNGLFYRILHLRTTNPIYLPGTTDEYVNNTYSIIKNGGSTRNTTDNITSIFNLKMTDVVKGLSLNAIYSPRFITDRDFTNNRLYPLSSLPVRNGMYAFASGHPRVIKRRDNHFGNNVQLLANYNYTFKQNHSFQTTVGYVYEDFRTDFIQSSANNLSSNDLPTLNLNDPAQIGVADGIQEWRLSSYIGKVNYAFDERLLLDASLRYDGSSKLAAGNKWHLFPSVGAGWRISQEKWFDALFPGFWDELKLRASWGKMGNDALGNYDSYATISTANGYPFGGAAANYYAQTSLASKTKTWEVIENSNIGLDMSLLKNRLNISGEYFVMKNTNMLSPMDVPATIGLSLSNFNVGNLENKGWEFSAGWRDQIGGVGYYVNGRYWDAKEKVTKYNGQSSILPGVNRIIEGMPLNSFYGYIADGLFQSVEEVTAHAKQQFVNTAPGDIRFRDVNGDGVINSGSGSVDNPGDLVYLGNPTPRHNFGFDFGLNWKGFDLSAFLQGVGKRTVFLHQNILVPFRASHMQPFTYNLDFWTPDNRDARFPRLYWGDGHNIAPSSHFKQNGAYVRLKNVQLGYTLPSALTKRFYVQKARVFFTGRDLWEVSKMWIKNFDPEEQHSTTASNAAQSYNYPFLRNYSMGINLTF